MNYYNENDPYAVSWLRGLIAAGLIPYGVVDDRSIVDVKASDLAAYTQCHFFAGVGGWPLALQLASWPASRPVWTGSCPCQPFSCAGKREGEKDERHLWPEFARLIRECRPPVVFGEQVEGAVRLGWLDGVFGDLEAEGYACGASVLGAHSVGAPHIRQRLYWVAHAECRPPERWGHDLGAAAAGVQGSDWQRERIRLDAGTGEPVDRLVQPDSSGSQQGREPAEVYGYGRVTEPAGRMGNPDSSQLAEPQEQPARQERPAIAGASWSDFALIPCRDNKVRRISAEPGDVPLVHGIPCDLGRVQPALAGLVKGARRNRVGRLKGYGNAIVPEVAAKFITAYEETIRCPTSTTS